MSIIYWFDKIEMESISCVVGKHGSKRFAAYFSVLCLPMQVRNLCNVSPCVLCQACCNNHICALQVARHLTKLFDSMAKLKFIKDSAGNESKFANGMWSKDGEYVDMDGDCDLSGQVK